MKLISDIISKKESSNLNYDLLIFDYSDNFSQCKSTFFQKSGYSYKKETKLIPIYEIYVNKITKSYITKFNKKDSLTDFKFPIFTKRLKKNYTNTKFM